MLHLKKLYVENEKSKSFLATDVAERDNSQLFYSLEDAAPKVRRQLAQSSRSSPSFSRGKERDSAREGFIKSTRCKYETWMMKW